MMTSAISTISNFPLFVMTQAIKKIFMICLGLVMTILLFYMMYMLIKNDSIPEVVKETPSIPSINFHVPDKIKIKHQEDPPIKPSVKNTPPRTVGSSTVEVNVEPKLPIVVDRIEITPPKDATLIMSNTRPLPMVKVAPAYPQAAAMRKIQGYVDVIFDVTETGATENIQIVYAEPEKIFNSAVLKAVSRWKYKPKMEEGTTTKMYGVRERIRFNLEK